MTRIAGVSALLPLVLLASLLACGRPGTPEVAAGIDGCEECGMVISDVRQAAVLECGARFESYCSPGCMLEAFEALEHTEPPSRVFVADNASGAFVEAKDAAFLLTTHRPTVMGGAVLAFADEGAADALREHPDELVCDWDEYRRRRGTPDRTLSALVGAAGLEPSVLLAEKGELVALSLRTAEEGESFELSLGGYPELGSVVVSDPTNPVEWRVLAVRPGAGFPVRAAGHASPLGMLKVGGAHTADEAAR